MSVAVMSDVWAGYPGGGSELLTLLALADYGNDDGLSIHPSIEALAHKVRVSESQVRRVLRALEVQKLVMVIDNHSGGAPGATRKYRLNVRLLRSMADKARAEMDAKHAAKKRSCKLPDFDEDTPCMGATPRTDATPCMDATPSTDATPRMDARDGLHGCARPLAPVRETGRMGASQTTIEPPIEPPVNHQGSPALCSTVAELTPATIEKPAVAKPARTRKPKADAVLADETELQAACRATWGAYSAAYNNRYGALPVRNAKVNAAVKGIVQRLGADEAPAVASFFVGNVNDAFVVRACHDIGLLLKSAEAYRTQWATGSAVTQTRARQADQSAANYDAAAEALALLRARRADRAAQAQQEGS